VHTPFLPRTLFNPSMTIMIIDDDDDDRDIFCEAVTSIDSSIKTIQCREGEIALQHLEKKKTSPPDFIFLDLNMPRVNGKQCLEKIKRLRHLQDVPVIIYSTSKYEKDIKEVMRLGASTFLTKPSRMSDLVKSIRLILKNEWAKIAPPSNLFK
jgi:DNA-binding response OmpR family regulator